MRRILSPRSRHVALTPGIVAPYFPARLAACSTTPYVAPIPQRIHYWWMIGCVTVATGFVVSRPKSSEEFIETQTVVIIGAGIAGLKVAEALGDNPFFRVIVLDRQENFTYQPLLPQVVSGVLSPAQITFPLDELLSFSNTTFLPIAVASINLQGKTVTLQNGEIVDWTTLVVAPGSSTHYFGHPEWEKIAPGLKTLQDADIIRRKIEHATGAVTVVGAGPTGIAIAQHAANTGKEVVLIDAANRILPSCPSGVSERAHAQLKKLGVGVVTDAMVTAVTSTEVVTSKGRFTSDCTIWAPGVTSGEIVKPLFDHNALDRGRVKVGLDLNIEHHDHVFVIGDAAAAGSPTAAVASQQATYIAGRIGNGTINPGAFAFRQWGFLVGVGANYAVGVIAGYEVSGMFPCMIKNGVECWNLPGPRGNKFGVFAALSKAMITQNKSKSKSLTPR